MKILSSFVVSFRDNIFLFAVNVDVSLVKIKTEADSNECSHDKPSIGMFAVSDDIYSLQSVVCISCVMFTVYVVLTAVAFML